MSNLSWRSKLHERGIWRHYEHLSLRLSAKHEFSKYTQKKPVSIQSTLNRNLWSDASDWQKNKCCCTKGPNAQPHRSNLFSLLDALTNRERRALSHVTSTTSKTVTKLKNKPSGTCLTATGQQNCSQEVVPAAGVCFQLETNARF